MLEYIIFPFRVILLGTIKYNEKGLHLSPFTFPIKAKKTKQNKTKLWGQELCFVHS